MSEVKRLMLIELNEFDPDFMLEMASHMNLRNVERALGFRHSTTTTDDRVEHQGLDPWVQWVSVHCGKPAHDHGIKRLGDTRAQASPQLWHALASRGYSWGAWGVMNAPIGNRTGCRFFMPDPWSFDEVAVPDYLNDLLALPRYAAKNYLEIDHVEAFKAALRLVRFFAPPAHWPLLGRFSTQLLKGTLTTGPNIHTFTTLLDYLGALLFVKLRGEHQPQFSAIFLNHIAHLQHQFWWKGTDQHPEMKLGLQTCDAILGLLLDDRADREAMILMNGLKQKNCAGEGYVLYRQRNPQTAIETMGVRGGQVEQCMTNDAHVLFEDPHDADHAAELLERAVLSDGQKVFYVERQGPHRVFYQLILERRVADGSFIVCGSYREPFEAVFQLVCDRTGAHVPEGDVFADGISVPDRVDNHKIFDVVLDYFDGKRPVAARPSYSPGSLVNAQSRMAT